MNKLFSPQVLYLFIILDKTFVLVTPDFSTMSEIWKVQNFLTSEARNFRVTIAIAATNKIITSKIKNNFYLYKMLVTYQVHYSKYVIREELKVQKK